MSCATVRRAVAAICVALTLSGCSALSGIRRNPPAPPVPSAAPSAKPPPVPYTPPEERWADVPVPDGFQLDHADFSDARHGAALYTDCDDETCSAVLVATDDGGRSWQNRPHPQPEAGIQEFEMGRDGTIVLTSDFDAWYVSHDNGATFRRSRNRKEPPAEVHTMNGPYQLDGLDLVHWVDGRRKKVTQPLGEELYAFAHRPGRDLWIASITDGRLSTAVSRDEAKTWTVQPVPATAATITSVELLVSGDGGEVWMLGYPESGEDFTAAWQLGAGGWNPVDADGPTRGRIYAAPVGRSMLAVSGDNVTGIIAPERKFGTIGWPVGEMRVLRDGTLLISPDQRRIFLGTGADIARHWARIEFPES